jgi:hypothetical protein
VEVSNRFVILENFDEGLDINSARESIKENIKTSAKENVRYHKLSLINHGLMMSVYN